jgi:pyruvate formate lyase activating enzyme
VLRCPYCHNPELITTTLQDCTGLFSVNREEEFFDFLKTRQGLLEGVVITGGEPTLHTNLISFIRRVKSLGFLVKLDTNGIFPDKVKAILKENIVDYWAMDIKHTPEKYHLASGVRLPVESFQQSVKLIMSSGIPYEFRTTVVPSIHTVQDFIEIGKWIAGAQKYCLQAFRPVKIADETLMTRIGNQSLDLHHIRTLLLPYITSVEIRD